MAQIVQLFAKARNTISEHISYALKEDELQKQVVCRDFRQITQHVAIKGKPQQQAKDKSVQELEKHHEQQRTMEYEQSLKEIVADIKRLRGKSDG